MKRAIIFGFVLIMLCSSRATACAMEPKQQKVPRDFSVQVLDWKNRPVPDIHVRLLPMAPQSSGNLEETTGENGLAVFNRTIVGEYEVTIDEPRGSTDYNNRTPLYIEVQAKPAPSAVSQVQLAWPAMTVLSAQTASGRFELNASMLRNEHPLVVLDLLEAKSRRKVGTANADADGNFSFPTVASGLYFINVTFARLSAEGEDIAAGFIAVEIEPTAKRERLDSYVLVTDCGLHYSER